MTDNDQLVIKISNSTLKTVINDITAKHKSLQKTNRNNVIELEKSKEENEKLRNDVEKHVTDREQAKQTHKSAEEKYLKIKSELEKVKQENEEKAKTIENLKTLTKSLKFQREKARYKLKEVCKLQSRAMKDLQACNQTTSNMLGEITKNSSSEMTLQRMFSDQA